jgi:TetR/AcrR family transcriptional repressor of lmrAB and yxaGH operons
MAVSPARTKMIEAASRLFSKQGYRSTTIRGIVDEAGSPWGSVRHYWPGGKEQLGAAAIEFGDQCVRGAITSCIDNAATASEAVTRYLTLAGKVLEDSGWETGCPVTTVALEVASDATAVTEACAAAFAGWRALWAGAFHAAGVPVERSEELATSVVGGISGALILSRVSRTTDPMRLAAETLSTQVESATRPAAR